MLRFCLWLLAVLALTGAGFVAVGFFMSERLDAITVRFVGPGTEARDLAILGLGKEHVKPDYRLTVVGARGEDSCGTIQDTSAAGGLRFVPPRTIPLREIRELALVEDDLVTEDEPVARVAFAPPSMTSQGYVFGVESSRSFKVGFDWFLGTPFGLLFILITLLALFWFIKALTRSAVPDGAQAPEFPDIEPPDLC